MSALPEIPHYDPRFLDHRRAMVYARRGKPWPHPRRFAARKFQPTAESMHLERWKSIFDIALEILAARRNEERAA